MAPPGDRALKTRVRTAGKRTDGSTRWLARQLNDPYVHAARRQGWRARSVFKLAELDRRFQLLRRGARVLDLGAAPGSWSQYAAQHGCITVGLDLLPVDPIPGVTLVQGDFLDPAVQAQLTALLDGPADLVLSDIAADATGTRAVDRLRAEAMAQTVLDFAAAILRPGGHCLVKLLKGAETPATRQAMQHFKGYRLLKPAATRKESSELYLLATDRRVDDTEGAPPSRTLPPRT